jgi:predicted RNA-binding Zn ribbon-like protein
LAASAAVGGEGRVAPVVTRKQAAELAAAAAEMRAVFAAPGSPESARIVNGLMASAGARPQLDPVPGGGWHVHFHGSDDTLATGWIAGCATALALALGSSLAGRLGVCEADRCDRVYVDTSRNCSKRFCTLTCQNRTKAAVHRARA